MDRPTSAEALGKAIDYAIQAENNWRFSGESHQAAIEAGCAAQVSQAWAAIAAIEQANELADRVGEVAS